MEDTISRQAVLDKFEPWLKVKDYNDGELNMLKAILYEIRFMPSARSETGKWISADAMFHGVPFYCSECGENTRDTVMGKPRWKFCPMCGAKMEVTT